MSGKRATFLSFLAVNSVVVTCFESIIRPEFEVMQHAIDNFGAGYDWANHEVHTDDSYILNLFRLVSPSINDFDKTTSGDPVLIMHGMAANGSRFINRTNNHIDGLAIALAKAGYDVWLGNNRGNLFSSEHETLDWVLDEEAYWDFSFTELGLYDLPALISTVLEETGGDKKIKYIGTSLGTT